MPGAAILAGMTTEAQVGTDITITVGSGFFSFMEEGGFLSETAWRGFRTSDSVPFGSTPATFGARTPTSFGGVTIHAIVRTYLNGDSQSIVIVFDGDTSAAAPFSVMEAYDGATLEGSYLRTSASVSYDAGSDSTSYTWESVGAPTWSGTRVATLYA